MIKKILIIITTLIVLSIDIQTVRAEEPNVNVSSAILIEEGTGRILWEKNADQSLPMASTTKIMTAIIALEYGKLNEVVTIDSYSPYVEGSSIHVNEGDKISLEDLIFGLMLRSGNDAAHAIAIHVGRSEKNFIELMNRKAEVIGANSTHFTNPHGLHSDDHYTTARDLALITQYAFKNKKFREIIGTKKSEISVNGEKRTIYTKNKLLNGYEGGDGVKTGYTMAAGKCLVFSASRDDMQLIGVILNADDIWIASRELLDFGFDNYSLVDAVSKGEYLVSIYVENGINNMIKIYSDREIDIPVKQGENIRQELELSDSLSAPLFLKQNIGALEFYIDDDLVYDEVIYCPQKVYERDYEKFLLENIYDFFKFKELKRG